MSGRKDAVGVFLENIGGESTIELKDAIPNEKRVRDIAVDVAESIQTVSIQTVLAEVIDVVYNEEDLPDGVSILHIGCIRVNPVVPFPILPDGGNKWVFPIDSLIKSYPIKGELVAIINLGAQTFYYPSVNMLNNVNNNLRIGIAKSGKGGAVSSKLEDYLTSKSDKFSPHDKARPVKQYPGDLAINGRNDQSIRIGKTPQSDTDAVIKLRIAEQEKDIANSLTPKEENINEDAASIYMTREEDVDINVVPKANSDVAPKNFKGPQIILDADQITFNTKKSNVNMYSANVSNFVSKAKTNIVSENVWIGHDSKEKLQNAVLADNTAALLDNLFNELSKFCDGLISAYGIGNLGIPVPIFKIGTAASGLKGWLSPNTKQAIFNQIHSPSVYIAQETKTDL